NRLRFAREAAFHPTELRRIQRWQLHHRHAHVTLLMPKFAPQRVRKSPHSVFCRAIGRLQRNSSMGQGRTDLHNHATIARRHSFERGKSAVNAAEKGHFRDTTKFFRRHFLDRRKNRGHGVVDPDVYLAKLPLDLRRRRFHLIGIGNIDHHHDCSAAKFFDLFSGGFQTVSPAGEKGNLRTVFRKSPSRCATNSSGGSSNNDHFARVIHSLASISTWRVLEQES